MGRNFVSICHSHQVKNWYLRGKESRGMHDFYREHDDCMRHIPGSVLTFDDQMQETLIPDYPEVPASLPPQPQPKPAGGTDAQPNPPNPTPTPEKPKLLHTSRG